MSDSKTFVLIPVDGRGLLTNWSPFNIGNYENSFSNMRDIAIRDNSWVCRAGDVSTAFPAGTGIVQHVYFYNAIDTTNAAAPTTSDAIWSVGNSSPYTLWFRDHTGTNNTVTTTTDPNDLCFLTIKNRCFVAGNGCTPRIIADYPSYSTYSWGKAGPTNDLTYVGYVQASNATTKVFYQATNGNTTATNFTITATAGTPYTASPTWDGKTVIFDGTEIYTIATSTTTVLTLSTPTPNNKANKNVEVHYGSLSWGVNPPKYAYAYYNPTTGHITNISPVLTISEQNMSNVNVALGNIVGTGDSNYTRIIIFRTARDGGTLYPLFLDVSNGGSGTVNADGTMTNSLGTLTYFDAQPDAKLGEVLGLFDASALILNQPAPTNIKFMEYWNQRVWCNTISTPWRLQFTGDSGQIPLGVSEESWPATNYRDITATDGQITGLRVVGDSLLVCTNKAIYYVAGSTENDFNLVRLSSRGQGVNHFAIDEHPGDSTNQSASAIYVSSDNRLWRHYPGGTVEDIGWQIQNQIDTVQRTGTNRPFIVKVAPLNKNWLLILGIRNQANTGYNAFFYDFDRMTWYDWGYGGIGSSNTANCFGAGYLYQLSKNSIYGGSNTGSPPTFYDIQSAAPFTGGIQPTFTTQALDLGSRRAKKSIEAIALYVSDDSLSGWAVQVQYDQAGGFVSYTKDTVSGTPRYRGSGVMFWSPPAPAQFHAMELKVIWGTTAGSTPTKVFRAEIIYRVESTGEAGSPS